MSLKRFSSDTLKRLYESSSYRVFIQNVMEAYSAQGRKYGYSELARKAGFAARSYPHDIVTGKKSISAKSLHKFVIALGLSGDLAEFFRLLVEREEPSCRIKRKNEKEVESAIQSLRSRVSSGGMRSLVFKYPELPRVYAALGEAGVGANAAEAEIQRRTRLTRARMRTDLEYLVEQGLVRTEGERYIPTEKHLALPGLNQSESFKQFFIASALGAKNQIEEDLSSLEKLFFSSCFSVRAQDLPKLKEDLRTLLFQYVDQAERSSGDRVVTLVAALF